MAAKGSRGRRDSSKTLFKVAEASVLVQVRFPRLGLGAANMPSLEVGPIDRSIFDSKPS